MAASDDTHFQAPTQHPRNGFDLIQPGGVAQVKQPVHLR